MPNLEYSVRFVLTADSTKDIDEALRRMRETGSTIEIKLKTDTSGFTSEMKKVKDELDKVEQATEKMSRSTQKGSGLFKIYGKEIRQALNQFRATGDLEGAQARFAEIKTNVDAFGNSLEKSGQDMQEFFTLTNQLNSATNSLNTAYGSSTIALNTSESAQKALNEESRKSTQIIRMNAQARSFEAKQVKLTAQEVRDNVTGQIALLRRLSVQGQGTAEEIAIAFNRTATTTEELAVTTEDLTQAFIRQNKAVEGSRMSFKNKQQTLNQIKIAEEQTAQSMRKVTSGLGQQENQVGDVSYAMMSFTRLLEDVPYGFRGFANNIQPTVYGLIQLNDKTIAAATEFRKLHGKEMPLTQRAMINLKSALVSPINQLLLLTSVVAVAGTMIERWSQQANKARREAKELGDEFLRLYDVTKGDNPLDTDYSQSIQGLEEYAQALEGVLENSEKYFSQLSQGVPLFGAGAIQGFEAFARAASDNATLTGKTLDNAKGLSKEARDRLKSLQSEAEVQAFILGNEQVRAAIQNQMNQRRVQAANDEIFKTQELIDIEKVRQSQGEQAAIRYQSALRVQAIQADATLNADQKQVLLKKETIDLELELLRLAGRKTNEAEKAKAEYESTVQALQRQLQDETQMFSVQRLRVEKAREIADLESKHAEAKAKGAEIAVGLFEQEKALIDQIYDARIERETQANRLVTENLTEQFQITSQILKAEQAYLLGQDRLGTQLELQAMEMEYQLQLKQQLADLDSEGITDSTEKAVREAIITNELKAQYRLRLLQRSGQERQIVNRFLSGNESEEIAIERSKNEALLANEADFLSRRQQAMQQFAGFQMTLGASLERYRVMELERMKAIEAKASAEINAIKIKTYTEGAMMIVGALSQLNDSSEAVNKAQFERQKRFSASLATINTLLAITQVLSDPKMGTFLKFAQASAMAITGFAQVRQILGTKYGNATTGGFNPQSQSQGFIESDVEARGSVNGTTNNFQPTMIVNVTGTVDKEGIAWAVMEGTDQINSRGIVLQ